MKANNSKISHFYRSGLYGGISVYVIKRDFKITASALWPIIYYRVPYEVNGKKRYLVDSRYTSFNLKIIRGQIKYHEETL